MKRAILDALRTSVLAGASQPSLDDGRLRLSRYETYEGALALARELVAIVPAGARVGLISATTRSSRSAFWRAPRPAVRTSRSIPVIRKRET